MIYKNILNKFLNDNKSNSQIIFLCEFKILTYFTIDLLHTNIENKNNSLLKNFSIPLKYLSSKVLHLNIEGIIGIVNKLILFDEKIVFS